MSAPTLSELRSALNVREVQLEPLGDPVPIGNGRWRVPVGARCTYEPLGDRVIKREGGRWTCEKAAPETKGVGEVGDGDVFVGGAK